MAAKHEKRGRKGSAGKVSRGSAVKVKMIPVDQIEPLGPIEGPPPLSGVPACSIVEPVPDEAAVQKLLAELDPAAQAAVKGILQGLAEHLGSREAARVWLAVPAPEFGTTPLEAIRNGKAKLVQAVLEGNWGPSPSYA